MSSPPVPSRGMSYLFCMGQQTHTSDLSPLPITTPNTETDLSAQWTGSTTARGWRDLRPWGPEPPGASEIEPYEGDVPCEVANHGPPLPPCTSTMSCRSESA